MEFQPLSIDPADIKDRTFTQDANGVWHEYGTVGPFILEIVGHGMDTVVGTTRDGSLIINEPTSW